MHFDSKKLEYHNILNQSPDGIYIYDINGKFIFVNDYFCNTLGYHRDELMQMNIADTYLESDAASFVKQSGLTEKETTLIERAIRRKDNSIYYAQIKLKRIQQDCIIAIVRDIVIKQDFLEKLRESETRFRQITEHIRDVFFLADSKNHEFLYISPAYEAIWRQSAKSVYTSAISWASSIHPNDKTRVYRDLPARMRAI